MKDYRQYSKLYRYIKLHNLVTVNNSIYELINKQVCELQVPWNLQYLTQTENCNKNNRFDGTYETILGKKESNV